jgi:hypothetical protein
VGEYCFDLVQPEGDVLVVVQAGPMLDQALGDWRENSVPALSTGLCRA